MKNFILFSILILIFSCSSWSKRHKTNDREKYIIAYNYLVKNNYIKKSYIISDTLVGSRIVDFSNQLCPKLKGNHENDTIPSKEILLIAKCYDSLNEIDRTTENIHKFYPLKKILNNFTTDSEYTVFFSVPVNDKITVQIRPKEYWPLHPYKAIYYLKINDGSVVEFYKYSITFKK